LDIQWRGQADMNQPLEISPSLFFQYAKSPHWIWYDIHGDKSMKAELPELTKRLIEGGVLHEEEYVKGLNKISIDKALSEEEAERQTLEFMRAGEELIYQGVISYIEGDVKFKGRPDLLKKCKGSSSFGDYYYMPVEIKNSTKCDKAEYKKQLMLYSIILNMIQGYMPMTAGFINKNKVEVPCELTEKIQKSTNNTIGEILKILRGAEPSLKISSVCKESPWFDVLFKDAKTRSDIALIYNVRADSLEDLRALGVKTISDMAACDIETLPKIKGASADTLKRAQQQAVALINGKIAKISDPDILEAKTKIYFDIEGDPFLGIQYLFGFLIIKENSEPVFRYFVAENPNNEGDMWAEFLSWLNAENFQDFKVYHYASYEKTYLGKLSEKYGSCQQLSRFVENLVDLSTIVTRSFVFPIYFYSIKDIAKHLDFKWQHAKAGGAQSIFWYEKWLETGDRGILQDIINYNEDDVRATEFLHNWLSSNIKGG
jgi:uncharacterized protein